MTAPDWLDSADPLRQRVRLPIRSDSPTIGGVQGLGKLLFIVGLALTIAGAILWKTGGLGGLGRLPGDIIVHKGNSTFYFPIVTCIVISLVLTLLGWLLRR